MSVLKRPLVTEKLTALGEAEGEKQYGFIVDMDATKPQIKAAIEEMYEVTVKSLRTMIYAGKKRNRYTRAGFISGKSPNYKKAVITLPEGQEIDFFKNI